MRRREPEEASIRAVTHEGRGIADVEGKKVFVTGALAGETVRFLRRKRHRNYDEAELLEVVEASESRVAARCEAFGRCGGCSLQHLPACGQRDLKQRSLADSLERIGKVSPGRWLEPVTAGDSWHYRRRARLAVKDVQAKGRVLVGFREQHAPYVTDMHRCEVLSHPVATLMDPLSDLVASLSIRRRLPQIEVAVADNATELVFRVLDPPSPADRKRLGDFGEAHRIRVSLQPGGPDSLEMLYPRGQVDRLVYRLPEFDVDIAFEPLDFVQVNGEVNRGMVSLAVELLDVSEDHRVLDLYCGIGNFTLPLARRGGLITGIEVEAAQVARAKDNALRNGIDNADFLRADLAAISGEEDWIRHGCDRLLLDPARSGAAEIVRRIDRLAPARIVYVSCHPATLARDAGILVNDFGYRLEAAGIIDMFPHTAHVESIAVFAAG